MRQELLDRLESGEIVSLTSAELDELLDHAVVIFEEDTFQSGMIRVLRAEQLLLVQETTDDGVIIARIRPTFDDARDFVQRRLDTYERMWDTCGLRVSYFDE
jgi:hypothetical protein